MNFQKFFGLVVNAAGGCVAVAELLEETFDGLPDPNDERAISLKCIRIACDETKLPFGKVMAWLGSIGCNCDLEFFAACEPRENPYIAGQWQRLHDEVLAPGPTTTASEGDSC